MTPSDNHYFQHRASEARTAAAGATDERAAQAHEEMARQYDELAGPDDIDPDPAA